MGHGIDRVCEVKFPHAAGGWWAPKLGSCGGKVTMAQLGCNIEAEVCLPSRETINAEARGAFHPGRFETGGPCDTCCVDATVWV